MTTRQNIWRRVHALRLVALRGWSWGRDPRRAGGLSLVSPRGTVFEFRAHGYARQYRHHTEQN